MQGPRELVGITSEVAVEFLSLYSTCIIQEVWQVLKEGNHMDFGPEGTPCLSAKLFWAMEFLGRDEGTGCFIQHISCGCLFYHAQHFPQWRVGQCHLSRVIFTSLPVTAHVGMEGFQWQSFWDRVVTVIVFQVLSILGRGSTDGPQYHQKFESVVEKGTCLSGKAGEGLASPQRQCS